MIFQIVANPQNVFQIYSFIEKNLYVSGPVQFKCVFFKRQLYFDHFPHAFAIPII